jgi:hypothetical protein
MVPPTCEGPFLIVLVLCKGGSVPDCVVCVILILTRFSGV